MDKSALVETELDLKIIQYIAFAQRKMEVLLRIPTVEMGNSKSFLTQSLFGGGLWEWDSPLLLSCLEASVLHWKMEMILLFPLDEGHENNGRVLQKLSFFGPDNMFFGASETTAADNFQCFPPLLFRMIFHYKLKRYRQQGKSAIAVCRLKKNSSGFNIYHAW